MKVFVDRFENGAAVIALCDDETVQFDFPRKYLPAEAREGSILDLRFEIDEEASRQQQNRAEELLRELTEDSDPTKTKFKL